MSKIVSKLGIHPNSVTLEAVKGKPALAISVARAPMPVSLDGHYYRRVGNTTQRVTGDELTRFLLERTGGHWDEIPCQFTFDALAPESIEDFKSLARNRLPAMRESEDAYTVLRNLRLVDADGRLLRAAVLLFGKANEPQRLSSTAFAQVSRFKGSGATIVDDKTITGNLFAQLDGVMAALRNLLQVRYEVPNEWQGESGIDAVRRREIWEYPFTALREAVANVLLHRDYTSSGQVMVRVFDDRLIVSSPGTLPEGVRLEDLTRDPHVSVLRNPKLAEAFYFAEIVERWGSGTTRMARECLAHGLPDPEFELVGGELWVTFCKDPNTDERLRAMGLSDRQIRAVRLAQEMGSVSNAEYREEASISARTALSDLSELVAKGVFEPTGGRGPTARYRLRIAQIAQ